MQDFEQWATANGMDLTKASDYVRRVTDGDIYANDGTQGAWECWQYLKEIER